MSINRPHLLLYSHDTFGLGHLRRNLAISQRLARDFPQISQLLVTGSSQSHHYSIPAELDYIKLPAIQKRASGDYRARTLDVDADSIRRWRADMILQAVREFEPNILLVDKSPAGMGGELLPTLEYVKRELPATRLVLGMRDINDAPHDTRVEWTAEGVYPLLEQTYDLILLYGSRDFFDPIREYGLSSRVAEKLIPCGHIRRTDAFRSRAQVLEEIKPRGEILVVFTAGGGGDGAAVLRAALEMLVEERRNGRSRYHAFVVLGPLMSREDRASLRPYAEMGLPLTMVDFTPDMTSYLHAADVVVSMGGYNTVCELLSLRQRAVIVPRVLVRREQLIRAERLAARGLVRMLHPAQLSPGRLRAEINLALETPRPDPERAGIDLGGLDRISACCGDMLGLTALPLPRLPAELAPSRWA